MIKRCFRKLFALLFFLFSLNSGFSQVNLLGWVYADSTKSVGLPNATMSLVQAEDTVAVVKTDEMGKYAFLSIKPGHYTLYAQFLGRKSVSAKIDLSKDLNYDLIFKETKETLLAEVQVTARKPLLERKADRLIFNIDQSPALQGLDLLEALSNVPMLNANENGLSIVGKSSAGLMINGRLLNLSGKQLADYIRNLRVENIASIEVITTPPSKYDSQGNGGLVNIMLKKNANQGVSGRVGATYIRRSFNSISSNAALNYQTAKLSVSTQWEYYNSKYKNVENNQIIGNPLSISKHDERKDANHGLQGSVNVNYKVNTKSDIGFQYSFFSGNAAMDIHSNAAFRTSMHLDSILSTRSQHNKSLNDHVANIYYDLGLGGNGAKLSLYANYMHNSSVNPVNFITLNEYNNNTYTVRNTSDINYAIAAGQGDFYLPLQKKWILETGVKYASIKNYSDVKYMNYSSEDFVVDPLRSNIFDYAEDNYAGYLSVSKSIGEKWSLKGGLRYEYTDVRGESPDAENHDTVVQGYGRLFPTFYLGYAIKEGSSLSFNYSKRINRPGFSQLNAFRWYSNPYTYGSGNPMLKPSLSDNLELSYLLGGFSATAYYQHTAEGYNRVTKVEGTTTASTFFNFFNENSIGAYLYYTMEPLTCWNSTVFAHYKYSSAESKYSDYIGQKGVSSNININNTLFLNKEKTLMCVLNYFHNFPRRSGNMRVEQQGNLTIGVNTLLLDKKLQISLMGRDIFRQEKNVGRIFSTEHDQYFNNYYDARRLTLSLSYSFGSSQVKSIKRDSKFEEKNRAN